MHFTPVPPARSFTVTDPTFFENHGIDRERGISSLPVYEGDAFSIEPVPNESRNGTAFWIVTRFPPHYTNFEPGTWFAVSARNASGLHIKRSIVIGGVSLGVSRLPWLQGHIFMYKRASPWSQSDFRYLVKKIPKEAIDPAVARRAGLVDANGLNLVQS